MNNDKRCRLTACDAGVRYSDDKSHPFGRGWLFYVQILRQVPALFCPDIHEDIVEGDAGGTGAQRA